MEVSFIYNPKTQKIKIESDFLETIRERFSIKNPGAFFSAYSRFIPKRLYAITSAGYCSFGLVPEICKYLKTLNIPCNIKFNTEYESLFYGLPFSLEVKKQLQCEFKLREYQHEAVKRCLERGHGIVELATGGGKTLIIANLVYNCLDYITTNKKILIIVPDIGLVEQTYKDFLTYNFPRSNITKWSGNNEINLDCQVIVANMGILQSRCSDLYWLKDVEVLIIDEVHKIRFKNKINKILDKIPTLRRFGFTGTLPESDLDKWNIMGATGPVLYKKTTTELRELSGNKYIANAQVLSVKLHYKNIPDYTSVGSMQKYRLELDFIYNSNYRYNTIKNLINNTNNNCLILVDHIDHGEKLYNLLLELKNKQVFFIQGSVEVEDRVKIQQLMEKNDNIVCIAVSKIFSTGISIKNIHYIMFAAGGKSKIKILQSIGRGLRVNENKSILTIIDVVDELVYGQRHYEKRKEFYNLENIKIYEKQITEKPS